MTRGASVAGCDRDAGAEQATVTSMADIGAASCARAVAAKTRRTANASVGRIVRILTAWGQQPGLWARWHGDAPLRGTRCVRTRRSTSRDRAALRPAASP